MRWVHSETPDRQLVEKLSSDINVNPILSTILIQRGIKSYEDAMRYFRPRLEDLHDSFAMMDMDKAVKRITEALEKKERILIYGDYDVDGTTAVVTVYSFLKDLTDQILYYLPDRYREGYGVSKEGIDFAIEKEVSLIICLDCGIRANDTISYAKENNIDFIICDHHLPGETLPPAVAILDPKQPNCNYPYKELSGCGIGFKLLQALAQSMDIPQEDVYKWLDLVAVSICADIVPIDGENRILTYYGLKKLNHEPLPGLKALIDIAGLRRNVDVSGVVFGIAPRINAAGRMHHAGDVVQLLLSEDLELAEPVAVKINDQNTERKNYDKLITEEALEMIASDSNLIHKKSNVLFNKSWHKGVIGIVASRVMETHYKPTIILTESNNMATGSARSVEGFDIYEAIKECSELLEQFGGHKYAAGITLSLQNVGKFQEKFETVVASTITESDLEQKLRINTSLDFSMIKANFYNIIRQMEPFGPSNPSPVFVTKNVQCRNSRVFGDNHLRMMLNDAGGGRKKTMEAIAFRRADLKDKVSKGSSFDVVYQIEENDYRNEKYIQLVVKDIWVN